MPPTEHLGSPEDAVRPGLGSRLMRYLTPAPDAPPPTESAVIAAIPDAEPLVGEHRQHLDMAAGWGVPAHVTVLYPFVPPAAINSQVISALAAATARVRAFDCRFARTRWFGQDVLWLDPQPDVPFRQLTAAIWEAFPDYPPYGGAYGDVVPHLTIAQRRLGDLRPVLAAERAVRAELPLSARVRSLLLIAGAQAPNSWRIVQELPLG